MWSYPKELSHHGILGMKWGVRRTPEQLGHTSSGGKSKKQISADQQAKQDRRDASKNRRTISTEELRERIERFRLEKQLKDLTEEDLAPGRKATKDILIQSGKRAATTIVTGAALHVAKEFGSAVFNGGAKKK